MTLEGRVASLGARAFDLLVALVERRDRVVSRNELLDLVWPGLYVEDGNLAVQVSTLRKLLGPKAIATIPGRGYRFILPETDPRPAANDAPMTAAGLSPQALPAQTLPEVSTALFGRHDDLATLAHLLREHRLVSVVGPGGIGKTSLALAAVHARPLSLRDGTAWVELAPMSDEALLPGAIAQALRLPATRHADPVAGLVEAMKSLEVLLVLDNAEHLDAAVARLAQAILDGAPGVRLLVTSQVALKLDHERLLRLGPLSIPAPGVSVAQALEHGAVALFVDQAKAADQRFELTADKLDTVISLCRQLDGLALALKLAAARLPFLGLKGLEARLDERMKLLRGGHRTAPTRQQTLMAALDWSHGLLSAAEQRVFRRLAVFVGGFTLELACAVAREDEAAGGQGSLDDVEVVDILCALVDRSLVAVDGGDRLLESTREYALVRLTQSGEEDAIRTRHTRAVTAMFEQADAELWVSQDEPWLATYTPELDNARAALDWAVQRQDPIAVSLMASLARLLFQLPLGHETRRRNEAVQPLVDRVGSASVLARYWVRRSHGQWGIDQGLALVFAQRAAELYRPLNDIFGLHEALFAMATSWRLPPEQMTQVLDEMRALERPGWPARIRADRNVAHVMGHYTLGDYEPMHREAQEGVANATESGSKLRVNILRWYACTALRGLGRIDEALEVGRGSIALLGPWRGWSVGYMLGEYVWCNLVAGRLPEARSSLREFMTLSRSAGWTAFGYHSHLHARLALEDGRHATAARLLGFADKSWRRIGTRFPDMVLERAHIQSALEASLDQAELQALLSMGELLDEETVCSLVFP
jgi:predicted ATPase/DNA-binding winged helix-turn-helix (wHTH) protein